MRAYERHTHRTFSLHINNRLRACWWAERIFLSLSLSDVLALHCKRTMNKSTASEWGYTMNVHFFLLFPIENFFSVEYFFYDLFHHAAPPRLTILKEKKKAHNNLWKKSVSLFCFGRNPIKTRFTKCGAASRKKKTYTTTSSLFFALKTRKMTIWWTFNVSFYGFIDVF